MVETVAVVVPWRDTGCEYRQRNLAELHKWLGSLGWRIILADSDGKQFNRSQARNNGVRQADADIVVIHDADLHVDRYSLRDTVRQVSRLGGLRHPYRAVRYLDEHNTQQLLRGRAPTAFLRSSRNAPGGCAVIRRDEYFAIGGYDESYGAGWGYEDLDFAARAKASIGHTWGRNYAMHLWHPEAARDAGTAANRDRFRALVDPTAIPMRPGDLDIVYRVRPGDRNEELRYSLRSLQHIAHHHVWMVGHLPSWVTNVKHIRGNYNPGKWANVFDNLRIACRQPEVSDPFILLDDDMFLLADLEQIPNYYRGSLADQAATQRESLWDDSIRSTLAYLKAQGHTDPISYELHIPYLVHKAEMLQALDEAADWSWPNPPQWRTLDGNRWNRGGEPAPDVKIRRGAINEAAWMWSSTDASFSRLEPLLAERFPKPCAYER